MIGGRDINNKPKPVAVVWDASLFGGKGGYALATNVTFTGSVAVSLDPIGDGVHLGDKITGDPVKVVDIDSTAPGTVFGLSVAISDLDGQFLEFTDVGGDIGANVHILDTPVGYTAAYGYDMSMLWDHTIPDEVVTGAYTIVGALEQRVVGSATPCSRGVDFKADKDNTDPIWVGVTGVTSGNGYPIYPGESKVFEIDDIYKLYIIGTADDILYYDGSTRVPPS